VFYKLNDYYFYSAANFSTRLQHTQNGEGSDGLLYHFIESVNM